MPKPPTPQPAIATPTGTGSSSETATAAMPATTTASPLRTRRRLLHAVARRSWTHAPRVHMSVAAVTAMLATAVLRPLTAVMASGT